jgi:DNA-binding response OmpR family regulator
MGKYHIQVVDDNQDSITLLSVILERNLDCKVSVANDGFTAFRQAREFVPNLILMDWMMPDFDGLQTIALLKADNRTKAIPVIMVTGVSDSENLIKAYEAGVSNYITKPFILSEMLVRVKSALRMNELLLTSMESLRTEMIRQALKTSSKDGQNSNLLSNLKEYENTIPTDTPKADALLTEIIQDLESNTIEKTWNKLENLVKQFEPTFLRKLTDKHPHLTPAEIKLCYLLRLNMSTKDISNLIFKTQEVVHLSRIRLRKKLQLHSDDNLTGYLLSF